MYAMFIKKYHLLSRYCIVYLLDKWEFQYDQLAVCAEAISNWVN